MSTLNERPRQIWHAGFIVDDVEEAKAELMAGIGLSFIPTHHVDTEVFGPGDTTYRIKSAIAFSSDFPLALELIQENPGTPNVKRGQSRFHHLGYWSDDLVAEDERLTALGYPCIYYRDDPDNGLRRILLSEGPYDMILESCHVLTKRPGLEHFYPNLEDLK
ncbi:VOC family protein [Streptomyces sp. NPDC050625]|uniref:VOC family protein n=1 Tax=Streptomyces sp. NPDC050625 TaxID=3154629 RepID=UPI0034251083